VAHASNAAVPLFMWTGRPYFNEHSAAIDSLSEAEFRQMFTRIASTKQEITSDMKYLNTPVYYSKMHKGPEVIVAFVFNELSSGVASRESGAYSVASSSVPVNTQFAYLKSSLAQSSSSFSAPFYLNESPISEDIISMHRVIAPRAMVFATEIDGDEHGAADQVSLSGCDALLNHLTEHPHIYSNAEPDLVLVKYSIMDRSDQCMARITDHINQKSGGNYLAVFSADRASAAPLQTSFAETDAHLSGTNLARRMNTFATATANRTTVFPGVTVVTPSVLWGLILALIMIIALSCGVCWIQSIETPARFTSTPLQLSKEY